MKVGWFSCGCSSLVACKLAKPDETIYIHVSNQHPDSIRFLADARQVLGNITVLQSEQFVSVDEVIGLGYINGPGGAACTLRLKKWVRQEWEREHFDRHTYVWGFDATEKSRADRTVDAMPEFDHEFPLIDQGLTKEDCHAICEDIGIKRPVMYDLGYPNNNCVGCVKGGKGYWNKIRVDFPYVFKRRSKQEREIGHSCIKGVFLDELDPTAGKGRVIVPSCSLACAQLEIDTSKGEDE